MFAHDRFAGAGAQRNGVGVTSFTQILKAVGSFIFTLVGPFLLVILGVVLTGVGLYYDLGWLTSGGIIAAVFGVLRIFDMAGLND